MESLFGLVANTLAIRTDLTGNPTFRQLLRRVQQVIVDALAHQDLPFERLVEELHPKRNPGYNPLFQVFFVLQNELMGKLELSGLTLSPMGIEGAAAMFDLMLLMEETAGMLTGSLHYNRDLFDTATIARFSERFKSLTKSIVRDPETTLSNLQISAAPMPPDILPVEWEEMKTRLSYHQERLWFIDRFETGNVYESNPIYHNIPLILQFEGQVDTDLLEQGLNEIVARHESLRTRIVNENDLLYQAVSWQGKLKLEVTDVSDSVVNSRVVGLAIGEAQRSFALDRDLLIRAALFRLADTESLLVVI